MEAARDRTCKEIYISLPVRARTRLPRFCVQRVVQYIYSLHRVLHPVAQLSAFRSIGSGGCGVREAVGSVGCGVRRARGDYGGHGGCGSLEAKSSREIWVLYQGYWEGTYITGRQGVGICIVKKKSLPTAGR